MEGEGEWGASEMTKTAGDDQKSLLFMIIIFIMLAEGYVWVVGSTEIFRDCCFINSRHSDLHDHHCLGGYPSS